MSEIIKLINKYQVFNNIFPGSIFCILFYYLIKKIAVPPLIVSVILVYFIGIIISRISSLITYRILNKITKNDFKTMEQYIKVSKQDEKIEEFLTEKNMYRNLVTTCALILIIKVGAHLLKISNFKLYLDIIVYILLIILILLFGWSYCKKNKDIIKRIDANQIINKKKRETVS